MSFLSLLAVAVLSQADGGTAASDKPALDVSKLPFNQQAIVLVMKHHKDKIQGCYNDMLLEKGGKKVDGKLLTSFVITGEGLVKNAKILKKGTTLKDKSMHDCVIAVLTTLEFPKPKDDGDHPVEFPFSLKASNE